MFGRVKSGTINASQLFFQGSQVFSIFKLRIHACNKNKITTFYHWQWKYLTVPLSKFVPYSNRNFKGRSGTKLKIIKKTNPVNTLRPLPKHLKTRKPFQGHGRVCRPRPPWPPQRSAARPRRRGLCQPPDAAPSSLGRRGCDAEGGAAAAAIEKQSVVMGCFSGLLGKCFWIGHR